ncbi:extracellular solute-binding protein [Paenibacillus jilunlii]|uniref:ABC transporter substrate-binding protein n=1 Tax=Paenibacillus jilunlii TaxID=682956 RepID=A0A1G9XL50_9BACL|nr:extracellular solute-binding protein [Paenibacillus jilunlii]KWX71786.1 ABC transporter substrate-binding protein [Paenibacillus jilunlii]SDM97487.1 carbohydrate ABC transporter substrate-binding protein, CUT1 family [Paenibacillus jilunlii]
MPRNKITKNLVLTSMLGLVLSGCSGDGISTGSPVNALASTDTQAQKVTITMMHLWPAGISAQQNKLVGQIIDDYQKDHPNVTIKQEVLENEQYKNKLKVLSASNELPDVGITWAAGFMEPYVKGGLFTPLDDVLGGEQLKNKFVPGTTEAYVVDGKTYALPIELNISPVYYNKDIFAKYNLQVPTTFDEFKHVVKTLSDNGVAPVALGNKDRWTGSLWYMYLADRIAGSDTLKKATNGTGSFDDPGLIRAAVEVQTLVDMNAFNKGFNGLSNDEGKSEFVNEQAAMYLTGTWELPNFTTNPDIRQEFKDKVKFFKFPTVDGGKGDINSWVGGPGVGLFVAESSKVKEEAKAFVEYFVAKWGQDSVTTAGVIPATKVDTSNSELPHLYVDLLNELNHASSLTLFADVQMKPGAAQVHLDMIQALFGKAVTPEQFAAKHKEAIEKGRS